MGEKAGIAAIESFSTLTGHILMRLDSENDQCHLEVTEKGFDSRDMYITRM